MLAPFHGTWDVNKISRLHPNELWPRSLLQASGPLLLASQILTSAERSPLIASARSGGGNVLCICVTEAAHAGYGSHALLKGRESALPPMPGGSLRARALGSGDARNIDDIGIQHRRN
jgi:hypothetical protein